MPKLDGFGFCHRLQSSGIELPIVFLTSEDTNVLHLLGDAMGAYLKKPVSPEQLLSAVKEQLDAIGA